MTPNLSALIPVSQSKAITGLARTTVYRLAGEGRLKLLKVDGRTFIERASFDAFMAQLPTAAVKPATIAEPSEAMQGAPAETVRFRRQPDGGQLAHPAIHIRDLFAGAALQGLLMWRGLLPHQEQERASVAAHSYQIADAMLRARKP